MRVAFGTLAGVATTLVAATSLMSIANALSQSTTGSTMSRKTKPTSTITTSDDVSRRSVVFSIVAGLLSRPPFVAPATAFDNGVPEMEQYKNKNKYPGTRPPNVGTRPKDDGGKLATCDDGLNCFSTSGDESHRLPTWRPPPRGDAMADLLETIKAYPPGQSRVDKGGFSIVVAEPDYLYTQFESMKHGFVDDVEFLVDGDGVQVRSASRVGELDLGVNAKRLNWISARLRNDKGWTTAPPITKEDYPDCFNTLVFTFDDYVRSVVGGPAYCPVPSRPLECRDPPGF